VQAPVVMIWPACLGLAALKHRASQAIIRHRSVAGLPPGCWHYAGHRQTTGGLAVLRSSRSSSAAGMGDGWHQRTGRRARPGGVTASAVEQPVSATSMTGSTASNGAKFFRQQELAHGVPGRGQALGTASTIPHMQRLATSGCSRWATRPPKGSRVQLDASLVAWRHLPAADRLARPPSGLHLVGVGRAGGQHVAFSWVLPRRA
jgi:hypothetical protein